MNLVRLRRHEHPAPPQRELRGRVVLDSHDRGFGDVGGIYVDPDERKLHLIQIDTGGFLGIAKKHYLVPVEAIEDETPGAVQLSVSEEDVKGSPPFDPHQEVDAELQRAVYDHYGYPIPIAENTQPA